jgi:single-strand DNA-binding protein
VIVVGHVYTSEYEDRDGNRRSNLEMRATSVGPDLSRSIVRIIEKTASARDAGPAVDEPVVDAESDEATDVNDADEGKALPLSA